MTWAGIRRHRVVLAAFGIAVLLGIAAYARIGPGAASIDAGVQAALLLVVSVTLAATAGAAGAVIGASIAAQETRANREDARIARDDERRELRRARFSEQRLTLAVELLLAADTHAREAQAAVAAHQGNWWIENVAEDWEEHAPVEIPAIHPSEAIRTAALSLELIAPEVASAGDGLYRATVELGRLAAAPNLEQQDPGSTKWQRDWDDAEAEWAAARSSFTIAVREDLGTAAGR